MRLHFPSAVLWTAFETVSLFQAGLGAKGRTSNAFPVGQSITGSEALMDTYKKAMQG